MSRSSPPAQVLTSSSFERKLDKMSSSACSAANQKGSRTVMWCVPRAISSAFAKCMCFVPEIEVWFEPYIATYVTKVEYKVHKGVDLPYDHDGNDEAYKEAKKMADIILQCDTIPGRISYASVKRRLEATEAKHVFVKDMGVSMMAFDKECLNYLPKGYKHTFLIRTPYHSLFSYRRAMYKHFSELGLLSGEAAKAETYDLARDDRYFPPGCFTKELYDLWRYVIDNDIDKDPIIIDCDDLLARPAEVLSAYCRAVGLPYTDKLLKWDASTKIVDSMHAAGENLVQNLVNFFKTAMNSSFFMPASKLPPRDQLPADVIRCGDQVVKYFEEMYEHRLQA